MGKIIPVQDGIAWEDTGHTDAYTACLFGAQGDEPGEVDVVIQSGTDESGKTWYRIAEEYEAGDEMYSDMSEAITAIREWCEDRDETPDLDLTIAEIRDTGYFDNPAIIPYLVTAMTEYSCGFLLVTPDLGIPVGTRWTTNGYLECDHICVPADLPNKAIAADVLLRSIEAND